jgi:hypothetical protein
LQEREEKLPAPLLSIEMYQNSRILGGKADFAICFVNSLSRALSAYSSQSNSLSGSSFGSPSGSLSSSLADWVADWVVGSASIVGNSRSILAYRTASLGGNRPRVS